jgi:hypothetical protein
MKKKWSASIMKNGTVKMVHDDDLVNLLKSLGVYNEVASGKFRCLYCGQIITIDNLNSIVPFEQQIGFTCDARDCQEKLIKGDQ